VIRRALSLAILAGLLAGCISAVEAPMQREAVSAERPVVLLIFASPAPLMDESNSNLEQAAKVIPGLGLFYSAGQSRRDLEASQQLGAALPPWQPAALFESSFRNDISNGILPGRVLSSADAGLGEAEMAKLNTSDDIVDWQRRYLLPHPDNTAPPRVYSMMPGLRETLILEVNLAYGAPSDGKGNWTPALSTVTKLIRASDNGVLWRHEERIDDKAGAKPYQSYVRQPAEMLTRFQTLLPALSRNLADAFRRSLRDSGAPPPAPMPSNPSPPVFAPAAPPAFPPPAQPAQPPASFSQPPPAFTPPPAPASH